MIACMYKKLSCMTDIFIFKYAVMRHLSVIYAYQNNHLVWNWNIDHSHLLAKTFDWRRNFLDVMAVVICKVKKHLNAADIYLFKNNHGNTRTMYEQRWRLSGNLNLNRFHILFCCFHCWLSASKCQLGK